MVIDYVGKSCGKALSMMQVALRKLGLIIGPNGNGIDRDLSKWRLEALCVALLEHQLVVITKTRNLHPGDIFLR